MAKLCMTQRETKRLKMVEKFKAKRLALNEVIKDYKIGDFIAIKFFVTSRFKHDRWYTMCNALSLL